jgi:altronate dehydratase small subunit
MKIRAAVLNSKDNVGLALMDLEAGNELELKLDSLEIPLKLLEPIRYQHKFSIRRIASGSDVIKYGEVIGRATKDIEPGQHVHIHNMTGLRGKRMT